MSTASPNPPEANTMGCICDVEQKTPELADRVGLKKLGLARTQLEAYSVFTLSHKRWIVCFVGVATFFSPLSASIYLPALGSLAKDLHVSTRLINLTITSYMVFQGIAPTFFGELADSIGRRPVYILLFVIYLGANIGLALQRSYPALIVLRMVQSTGSSGVVALAMGVVADISHAGECGMYMGIVNIGAMLGPTVGPVLGGVLVNELGWWWIFYLLIILSGSYLVALLIVFPETGRKIVGNGSAPPPALNMTLLQLLRGRQRRNPGAVPPRAKLNPLSSMKLILQKDMAIVLFSNSLLFTAFYTVLATIPKLFEEIYGYNPLQIGLCYLPFGVGCVIAGVVLGKIMDSDYRVIAKQNGITVDNLRGDDMKKFPTERARLRSVFWLIGAYAAIIVCYGWVLHAETTVAAPLALQFCAGAFGCGAFTALSTLVMDLYPARPSSATACNNLVRCLMGAGGMAAIESMIKAMGRGWCYTFIGLMCAAVTPLLLLEKRSGMGWRVARLEREEAEEGKEGKI